MIGDVRPRRRDVLETTWPGGGKFNILALRCSEIQKAHFEAVKRFENAGQPMDGVSLEEFIREKDLQEAYLMCLSPDCEDPEARLFKKADQARRELSLDEVAWVQNEHTDFCVELLKQRGLLKQLRSDDETEDENETEEDQDDAS
jgi:hypothetical protein